MNMFLKLRHSQIKIKEMIFMLLALAIFFSIILMFYLTIAFGGIKEDIESSTRAGNILLVLKLAEAPEFSCGESACIDTDKLISLINHPIYKNYWNVDGLVIEKITNETKTIRCNSINYPRCNYFVIKEPLNNTIADSGTVSLCRQEISNNYPYVLCELGQIKVMTLKNEI